jgi:hypothetical protein
MRGTESILLRLEVDRDADPITGTLTERGETGIRFTGWLGLTNAIESIRGVRHEGGGLAAHSGDEHDLAD